jgi:formylglycine-generating enzyme required for sulfatase activity
VQRWFLSFHAPDQKLAERLKHAIEHKDPTASVFFAPTRLRAGHYWSAQLAEAIDQSSGFILLVGEHGIGDWQILEYDEALDKRVKSPEFPLLLVLLEGQTAPGLPFLRRFHWLVSPDPASDADIAQLFAAAAKDLNTSESLELWRYASPYRGLAAMEEKDSDYFFGRGRETVTLLSALASAPNRLPILMGNSGVGKSSLAQAGVLAALKRQAWPEDLRAEEWPMAFRDSRRWCFLNLRPTNDPIKAIVSAFINTWQFSATDPDRVKHQNGWIKILSEHDATISDLIDATTNRHQELNLPEPPVFFLYVDQAEELYVRSEQQSAQRFSELLREGLSDGRLRAMMSMRSDFLGHLQSDEALFKIREQIDVPPLHEAELREIVNRPASLLSAQFEAPALIDVITRRTAEESIKGTGALPLLSYTLDDMWTQMIRRGDGVLRLPAQSFELGGVLVDRAHKFVMTHPDAETTLTRMFTLKLASVREDGEPTRRRAARAEFSDQEWRLVSELADYPNRLLVTVTSENGETYAEVAHEAIFRRWDKLRDWIAAEREFLTWRGALETSRRAWEATPHASRKGALLMGYALTQANAWLSKRRSDVSTIDCEYIALSRKAALRQRIRIQALVGALTVSVLLIALGWLNQTYLQQQWRWYTVTRPYVASEVRPYVLTKAAEKALHPRDTFKECSTNCPEMTVVPAGSFLMGSATDEDGHEASEEPMHTVEIAQPFAVSKFSVRFADWDACSEAGDCPGVSDDGFGRGQQPVINVSWHDAQQYASWLSRITGKKYRLLSEAEYEYAARANTRSIYPWGDNIGSGNANCGQCGSKWDGKQPAPVGSFAPNQFGLYDMIGNVGEWTEDCDHRNYDAAPTDGSAWIKDGDCSLRIARGGSWANDPVYLRSSARVGLASTYRNFDLGFRVARSLKP